MRSSTDSISSHRISVISKDVWLSLKIPHRLILVAAPVCTCFKMAKAAHLVPPVGSPTGSTLCQDDGKRSVRLSAFLLAAGAASMKQNSFSVSRSDGGARKEMRRKLSSSFKAQIRGYLNFHLPHAAWVLRPAGHSRAATVSFWPRCDFAMISVLSWIERKKG